jgi:hypothetical protein
MNQIWNKPGQNVLGKKSLQQQPKILVLEDEQGMKTSYFPGLAWNDMGYSIPEKIILRDIGRHYESTMGNNPISDEFRREGQIFLHSNLLYLISATDSNEAAAGHSQLVARYTLLLTKAMGIEDRAFLAEIERGACSTISERSGSPIPYSGKPGL